MRMALKEMKQTKKKGRMNSPGSKNLSKHPQGRLTFLIHRVNKLRLESIPAGFLEEY